MKKLLKIILVFFIVFQSCINEKKTEPMFWENYSETMNNTFFTYNMNNNSVLIEKKDTTSIKPFVLEGVMSFKESKVIIRFDTIKDKFYSVILFDYKIKGDTIINIWPVKRNNEYVDSTISLTILDTSFYNKSYDDTIYKFKIFNYCGYTPKDNIIYFSGKDVGIVGSYNEHVDLYGNTYLLIPNGNLFFDIFENEYKNKKFLLKVH